MRFVREVVADVALVMTTLDPVDGSIGGDGEHWSVWCGRCRSWVPVPASIGLAAFLPAHGLDCVGAVSHRSHE
jgi:hypothetical protein